MTPLSRSCAAALITLSIAGCHAAMSNSPTSPNDPPRPGYSNSSESASVSIYPSNLKATRGPYRNFPSPAIVTWRSKDGTAHRAEVDIGEIFKDQLVRHNVARGDVGEFANDTAPGIILEVNDRTINVYMRAMIWTKDEQIPGNKHSDYRNDLIKAYTRTY